MKPDLLNGKATKNRINQRVDAETIKLLTEDEQLERLAKLIIDIYLDHAYEKEKCQQQPASTARNNLNA